MDLPAVQLVLFAGGAGRRLGPCAPPKPLLAPCGVPLIDLQIAYALVAGFREFTVLLGHGADEVRDHVLRSFPELAGRVRFHVDEWDAAERPYGTGRALWSAMRDGVVDAERPALTLFCDDFYASARYVHDVVRAYERGWRRGSLLAVVLAHPGVELPYGVVHSWRGHFNEKPQLGILVAAGMYLLTPLALRLLRETLSREEYYSIPGEVSFEKYLLEPFSRQYRVEPVTMRAGDWLAVNDWKSAHRLCNWLRTCDWLPHPSEPSAQSAH